jgi:hypothetical protein
MRPRRLTGISASSDLRDGFRGGRQPRPRGVLYIAAFHLLLGRVYDDKDVQELIVRRSNVDWVIVRPVRPRSFICPRSSFSFTGDHRPSHAGSRLFVEMRGEMACLLRSLAQMEWLVP